LWGRCWDRPKQSWLRQESKRKVFILKEDQKGHYRRVAPTLVLKDRDGEVDAAKTCLKALARSGKIKRMKLSDTNCSGHETIKARRLFMVLSPRSLPYASLALSSLLRNADETLSLTLITDSDENRKDLIGLLDQIIATRGTQQCRSACTAKPISMNSRQSSSSGYHHLQTFRRGHPCWRKITDPVLLSEEDQEMVIFDPDVYFPNRFRFELAARRRRSRERRLKKARRVCNSRLAGAFGIS
jgi:hypothetical protein